MGKARAVAAAVMPASGATRVERAVAKAAEAARAAAATSVARVAMLAAAMVDIRARAATGARAAGTAVCSRP